MWLAGVTLCGHGEKASLFTRRPETVDHNRERERQRERVSTLITCAIIFSIISISITCNTSLYNIILILLPDQI